jgi:polysaccharide export outer membrane protein
MAKSNFSFRRNLVVLLGVAVQVAILTLSGGAQSAVSGSSSFTPSVGVTHVGGKGPSNGSGQGPVVVPKDFSELRIEPGDLLSVNVFDAPEFSNSYRVDPGGDLTLPLCGKVNLRGLTMTEAGKRLETALKEGQILTQPQVSVDVQQYASQYVTVSGEVGNPGRVTVFAPTRLSDVLTEAGGVTALASAHIRIQRGSDDAAPDVDLPYSRSQSNKEAAAFLVRPGDSVLVPRAGVVYVLGAVTHPGGYLMQEDGKLNVAEALALSGGTLLQANTGGLRVIRRNPDGTVLDFPLSYNAIAKGTQTPLALEPRDIVYVPISGLKTVLSSTLLGEAAYAAIITR